ncbi:hypothetical protein [Sediminibacterium sp. C3]|uniref:hypothetical protein n=1 Tax=Sediminibacterium sp. C3 TaxID=1267211 RepID=UPI0004121D43|nr:hypothetical protein [Sediminibacterium sp. C3]
MKGVALAKRSLLKWSWKLVSGVLLYVLFYIIAWMILQASLPELDQFYKGKIPAFQVMIYMQLVSTAPKWRYAVLVGMVFSILGGIAPLLPPNNLMPAVIRVGHGFEVGISNFLFGWITGVVLYRGENNANWS